MDEHTGILYCLRKMEERNDWKPSMEWTDHDFKLLKQQIYDCSNISISTHTLKRLFGKIKYKASYTPQHATKDALAIYLGYNSWEEFLKNESHEISAFKPHTGNNQTPLNPKGHESQKAMKGSMRRYHIYLAILAVAAGTVFILLTREKKIPEFSFVVENGEGVIPHTVTFHFDISHFGKRQGFINYDYIHPNLGSDFFLMEKDRTLLNHTYQIPGVYRPKLMLGNITLDSLVVVARSKDWVTFIQKEGDNTRFWMDNMLQSLRHKDFLTFSRPDIEKFGFDSTGIYYTTHRNIRDFGVSGDNFKLEVRFVNGPQNGGISCYDSRIMVICENSSSLVRFMEPNCFQYCELKFGENHYLGQTSDLAFLSRDLFRWNILRMEVIDKQASIIFNGEKTYSESYTQESGSVKGLEARFKGSGIVDYMLMTTVENDTVYFEDFKQ